jgi:hypothetical protein
MKHVKDFSSGFTKLHAKLDADTLDFCHPLQTKQNVKSKKHACKKKNVSSQCRLMWQTDEVGLQKCDLGLPSQLLSPRQLQQ